MVGNRESVRLWKYDYSLEGGYFVTICTFERACVFGEIVNGVMRLNIFGESVFQIWQTLPSHFPSLILDEFVVMPNHLHGIITFNRRGPRLGQVVGYFKYQSTKMINELRNVSPVRFWQRNYHEHVIRDEKDLERIREYIFNNPLQWHLDQENPRRGGVPPP